MLTADSDMTVGANAYSVGRIIYNSNNLIPGPYHSNGVNEGVTDVELYVKKDC